MKYGNVPFFVMRYGEQIKELMEQIFEGKPDVIVTITRKGPRLIDLSNKFGFSKFENEKLILSDRALAYTPHYFLNDKIVNVMDDIVIYGSTMKRVCSQVAEMGGSVQPFSLAVSIDTIRHEICNPSYIIGLQKTELSSFNNSLVRSFRSLSKPYDVDHPILQVRAKTGIFSKYDLEKILKKNPDRITHFDLTSPEERISNIANISIFSKKSKDILSLIDSKSINLNGLEKVRMFFDFSTKDVTLAPIFLYNINNNNGTNKFFAEELEYFNIIIEKAKKILQKNELSQKEIETSIFRLQLYFTELLYGISFFESNKDLFFDDETIKIEDYVNKFDLQLLFGPILSNDILDTLRNNSSDILSAITKCPDTIHEMKKIDEDTKPKNQTQSFQNIDVWNKIEMGVSKELTPDKDLLTNFNTIFRRMYLDIEKIQRDEGNRDINRLQYGLKFGEIRQILHKFNCNYDLLPLSAALDYFVDRGNIVPIFLHSNNEYFRAYRFGENVFGPEEFKFAVGLCTKHLEKKFNGYIPRFNFEKIWVLLFDSMNRRFPIQWRDIDISLKYDVMGAVLEIGEFKKSSLSKWCETNNIIRKSNKGYEFNPFFEKQYPEEESSVDKNILFDMKGIITLMADLHRECKNSNEEIDYLLALTTCNNEESFINSLTGELELWFTHPKYNFVSFLSLFDEIKESLDSQKMDVGTLKPQINNINTVLYNSANFFRQSNKKILVWKNLATIENNLEKIYLTNPKKDGFSHIYEKFLQDSINKSTNPKNEDKKRRVLKLIEICQCLTSLSRTFLSENGYIEDHRKQPSYVKDYIVKYNKLCDSIDSDPALLFRIRLSTSIFEEETIPDRINIFISEVTKAYNELYNNYRLINTQQEPQIEIIKENRVILYYDQINSANEISKEERTKMSSIIYSHLERHISLLKDGEISPTGDDSNTIIFREKDNAVRTALHLIQIMSLENCFLKVGLSSTEISGNLYQDIRYNKVRHGAPFEVTSRIANYYKENGLNEPRRLSQIFMTQEIADIFFKKYYSESYNIDKFDSVKLRGAGLPTVDITCVSIRPPSGGK